MNRIVALFIIAAFAVTGFGYLPKAEAADDTKIGYVDVASVFDSYDKTKDKDAVLGAKSETKQKEREKMVEKIRNMKNELELLSDKESQNKQAEIDAEIRKLQDFDRETKATLQRERDDMVREILKEIDSAIEDYAKKNKYTVILNSRVLVYAKEQMDITKEILNTLNSNYIRKK